MAVFQVQGKTGRTFEVEASSMHEALKTVAKAETMDWGDVPGEALRNAPASAGRLAENVVYPFTHPVEFFTALKDLGVGLGSKALEAVGVDQAPEDKERRQAAADALGQFIKDRYGSMDAFKTTLATDPVGVLADASLVLTGGGAAAARVPGVVGKAAAATRKVGQALDPVMAAGKGVQVGGKALGGTASRVIGITTGTGHVPYETAFQAGREGGSKGQAFRENIRGGSEQMGRAVDMAKRAVGGLRKERSDAYNAGMAATRGAQQFMPIAPINGVIHRAMQTVVSNGFVKDPEAVKVLRNAKQTFDDLVKMRGGLLSASDLDDFKQALYNTSGIDSLGDNARRVLMNTANEVKAQIEKVAPDYAKTMKDYGTASTLIKDMEKTLSLGRKATEDTALRKLQSTMRDNVSTNYGARRRLVDELARFEPDLPATLAGQTLSEYAPRGLARVGAGLNAIYSAANLNPAGLAAAPFLMPRLMGETAHALGRGFGAIEQPFNTARRATGFGRLPPTAIPAAARAARVAGEVTREPMRGSVGPGDQPLTEEEKQLLMQQLSR